MNIISIINSSIKRQKGKKLFLLIAMVLGYTTILSLFFYVESQRREIEGQFDEYGANIIITPKSESLSLTYGGVNISGIVTDIDELNIDEIQRIWTIPNNKNLRAVSPKLIGVEQVSWGDRKESVILVGVDPSEESKIKSWWDVSGEFPMETGQVMPGSEAALKLGLKIGDTLEINNTRMKVSGILKSTGSQDDNALIAPLANVENIFGKKGKISIVEVSALCSDCPIDDLVTQISGVMPNAQVRAIRQVMEQRMIIVEKIERLAFTISIILISLCGLLIFSTVSGSITERRKEIGIFRAIGFSSGYIMRIILGEYLFLGFIAGLIGIGTTLVFVLLLLPRFPGIGAITMYPDFRVFAVGMAALIILGLTASFLPAKRAAGIDPVQTMNSF
jgi:putative ABC transport system permease protein